ncbi:MAG: stage II sporulation protein D [Clostridia bacterium]|jgi:stage II sporulation protein D|nr:stage II sporulation protein D [Clostridia bacterium]
MKKYIICLFLFFVLCFAIPIFFTSPFKPKQVSNSNIQNGITVESTYDYNQYKTVKLLHKKTQKIENLPLDEYLYGVVSSEMPASFEKEALKAQAVVARTYTLYKMMQNKGKHKNADICDDSSCCQAWISKEDRLKKWDEKVKEEYWNKIVNAVNETQGKMITYEGKPINAFFHANSGGTTETPINVWGGSGYPYLQTVQTAGEEAYSQYASKITVNKSEFEKTIKKEHSNFKIDFNQKDCIKIKEYTQGNRIKNIQVGNLELSGVEMRNLFKLRSANFKIKIEKEEITFEVTGYGHGVGMSQTGADSLAKQGKTYEDIIYHYYTGVKIKDI